MKQSIVDHGDSRKYWTQIPNIVLEILKPLELTLYVHLKRAAGEGGYCTKSTATLARETGMGAGTISRTKTALEAPHPELKNKPLIVTRNVANPKGGKPYQEIAITDVWLENAERYGQRASSTVEVASSRVEVGRVDQVPVEVDPSSKPTSTVEIKKNSKKNIQEEQGDNFLNELKTKPLYARLDLDAELAKAETWAEANHKRVTRRFFVNWINRSLENLPLNGNGKVGHDAAWHARQAELARRLGREYRPDAA